MQIEFFIVLHTTVNVFIYERYRIGQDSEKKML
jgi:hypothetical protein